MSHSIDVCLSICVSPCSPEESSKLQVTCCTLFALCAFKPSISQQGKLRTVEIHCVVTSGIHLATWNDIELARSNWRNHKVSISRSFHYGKKKSFNRPKGCSHVTHPLNEMSQHKLLIFNINNNNLYFYCTFLNKVTTCFIVTYTKKHVYITILRQDSYAPRPFMYILGLRKLDTMGNTSISIPQMGGTFFFIFVNIHSLVLDRCSRESHVELGEDDHRPWLFLSGRVDHWLACRIAERNIACWLGLQWCQHSTGCPAQSHHWVCRFFYSKFSVHVTGWKWGGGWSQSLCLVPRWPVFVLL